MRILFNVYLQRTENVDYKCSYDRLCLKTNRYECSVTQTGRLCNKSKAKALRKNKEKGKIFSNVIQYFVSLLQ